MSKLAEKITEVTLFDRLKNLSIWLLAFSTFGPPIWKWIKDRLTSRFIQMFLFSVKIKDVEQIRGVQRYIKLLAQEKYGIMRVVGRDEELSLSSADRKDNEIIENNDDKLGIKIKGKPNIEAILRRNTMETQLFRIQPNQFTWLDCVPLLWIVRGQWLFIYQGDSFLVKMVPIRLRHVTWQFYDNFIHQALVSVNNDIAMKLYSYLSNFSQPTGDPQFTLYTLYQHRHHIEMFQKQAAQVNHRLSTKELNIGTKSFFLFLLSLSLSLSLSSLTTNVPLFLFFFFWFSFFVLLYLFCRNGQQFCFFIHRATTTDDYYYS